ncbi:MAG: ATP-binding protein [Chloroflexota bacterium]|nr:ATP-binding protein [Chloroflexota bacterium]
MSRRSRASGEAVRSQTRVLAERAEDVARGLRAAVPAPETPVGRPALVLLMGFPGVGKSHCARLLAERLGAAHVASDHLRAQLFIAASYAREENAAVFRLVDGLVETLLEEGHRVIVDATHLRAFQRASAVDVARRRGVPLALVLVTSDESDVLARLAARASARAPEDRSDADRAVYEMMRERGFEEPDDGYLTLRNGPDVASEIERVASRLEASWRAAR